MQMNNDWQMVDLVTAASDRALPAGAPLVGSHDALSKTKIKKNNKKKKKKFERFAWVKFLLLDKDSPRRRRRRELWVLSFSKRTLAPIRRVRVEMEPGYKYVTLLTLALLLIFQVISKPTLNIFFARRGLPVGCVGTPIAFRCRLAFYLYTCL
jgi:hypothetical protein